MASQGVRVASNSLGAMSAWKDIRPPSQRQQSPQKRTESPKTGREEETRKMLREAKIITRPSLPATVPSRNDTLGAG